MLSYGIKEGALLVVDKSLKSVQDSIVITPLQGELVCRALDYQNGKPRLICDGDIYLPDSETGMEVWGVVIAVCFGVLPVGLRKGRYSHVCTM